MADDLVPLADLADYFQRSRRTLYRWADSGAIPTLKVGGTIYMRRADIDGYAHPTRCRCGRAYRVLDGKTAVRAG